MACCKDAKLGFISEDGIKFELYVDGERVSGVRYVNIHAGYDEFVTHEVEYLTLASGKGQRK
jgi:hypothetical protein